MATLGTKESLYDLISQTDRNGDIAKATELLVRRNDVLKVIPFAESNRETGHQSVQRTALPSVSYAKFNEGTATSKANFRQILDTVALMEGLSNVDERELEINNWKEGYRFNRDKAFVEAFNQQFASDFFYSDSSVVPEKFDGMAVRYGAATQVRDTYGYYLINGGNAGSDSTSIWLMGFGEDGVQGLYGKGKSAGLRSEDMGRQRVIDASSNAYYVWETKWSWDVGLRVADPATAGRIANIDVSLLQGGAGIDIDDYMIRLMHLVERADMGQKAFVVNRSMNSFLHRQANSSSGRRWTVEKDQYGKEVTMFLGVPILVNDAILNNEAVVGGTFQTDI